MKKSTATVPPTLSILIKAYNEENHIESCIKSALKASEGIATEIILADSLSTDRTVTIAANYPITIVQLTHASERCCGIGPQLGYCESKGEFIYILDGDMEIEASFLKKALLAMEKDPNLGGVGGQIKECNVENMQFQNRSASLQKIQSSEEVEALSMGGMYRREAINSVGYFSNRNLHAFEELDLGLRLHERGWKLIRIDTPAIKHYGHSISTIQLLVNRFRSGYARGPGEIIRASLTKSYLPKLLWKFKPFIVTIILWIGLISSIIYRQNSYLIWTVLNTLLVLPLIMIVRKKSISKGFFSIVTWNVFAAGTITGFCKRQISPSSQISRKIIREE